MFATPVTSSLSPPTSLRRGSARQLYFALLGEKADDAGRIDELTRSASRSFLAAQLDKAATLDSDFPTDARSLTAWLDESHRRTAGDYRRYLDERQDGAPRRFFSHRSHALNFIEAVAPTKLVDGAWLYGLLPHWREERLAPLIGIYLEELGDGAPHRNHVSLYRQLLGRHGGDSWQALPDVNFVQGAVQLSLAHHAEEFLPEIIGFNLGYEQLPLHLPITAYELNELGIDPYYFTLHVTIDNASTGHARKALQCAIDYLPRHADAVEFLRRLSNGYRLNEVGRGTCEAIAAFDLEAELLQMLAAKADVGALLHSDYCRIGGRTVSDWLDTPGEIPAFLATLQSSGWILRGRPARESRFWRLMTDARAPMFGVFDEVELQLLEDWIVDDHDGGRCSRPVDHFRRQRSQQDLPVGKAGPGDGASVRAVIAHFLGDMPTSGQDPDIRRLAERLASATTRAQAMAILAGMLSPANHPTPAGLLATRLFSHLFSR
jgi:hypothetical protein